MKPLHLCILAALAPGFCVTAQAATAAWYRFENGTAGQLAQGKGTIIDSSGNHLDGTPHGDPMYVEADTPDSTIALQFGGKTRVRIHDDPLFQLRSMTLEAYILITTEIPRRMIVARSDDRFLLDPWWLGLTYDGNLQFQLKGKDFRESYVTSPAPLPMNTWIHVAGTFDNTTGTQAVFINGQLAASTITDVRPNLKLLEDQRPSVWIGCDGKGFIPFGGLIDELRISDVALDPSQFLPPP